MSKDLEKRILSDGADIQLRTEQREDGTKVYYAEGYALLFGVESKNLGDFNEIIEAGALDNADMTDVIARTHHDDKHLLGRTKSGTLTLSVDEKGLRYSVMLGENTASKDLINYLERGDISESSFAFTIDYENEGQEWVDRSDDGKIYLRKVKKIKKIYDVSPVVVPAYAGTSVEAAKRHLTQEINEAKALKELQANTKRKQARLREIQAML